MTLGFVDWAVLIVYFAVIVATGFWFGRQERDTHDFFLGARRQHWLVVSLSIIATEVSALTFISVPGLSFVTDWSYLQYYAGAFVGRILIVYLLLPAFYGTKVTTVYEYLGIRFGPKTRSTASLLFFVSRILGSGIRLLAASIAIAVVFQWPLSWVVIGAATLAIGYATFGGIKAIIWTDAVQALVFLGGGIAVVAFLVTDIPAAVPEIIENASRAEKWRTFHWELEFNNEESFWVLLIGITMMNMAALGTDQDLTQRMLTCPDLKRGQRSLLFNAFFGLPVVSVFLLIGTLMFVHQAMDPQVLLPQEAVADKDRVFPYFISTVLPQGVGLRGLLVAGIFAAAMSSLDSALGALSSTAVTDFYRPYLVRCRRGAGFTDDAIEKKCMRAARWCSAGFGVVIVGVALSFANQQELLWEAFKWTSLIFGGMLGVFLLGVLTKNRGHDSINVAAMLTSIAGLATLKYVQEQSGVVYIVWPLWVVCGTIWTFGVSWFFSNPRRHFSA